MKSLKENICVDSFPEKSTMVTNLLEILVSFNETQKGLLLKFLSGSSRRLTCDNTKPGFKNLLPRLKVELKMMGREREIEIRTTTFQPR